MKKLISLLSLLTLSACSVMDVDYKVPTNHFLTPETQGARLALATEAQISTPHKISLVDVTNDIFTQGVRLEEHKDIESTLGLGLSGYLGLFERLDAILALQDDSANKIGLKFQPFGEPEKELTKGFKLSVAALYGGATESEQKVELKGSRGNTKDTVEGTLDFSAHEFHLIPGYRLNERFLVYADGFYQKYKVEGELISKNNGTKTLDHFSQNHGANLGVRFSSSPRETRRGPLYLGIQTGWAKTYAIGQDYESRTYGVNLGINWN